MRRVLVLTGTPGVGKSSIGKLLAIRLSGRYVDLGDLVKTERLHCGFDTLRETLVADIERVSDRVETIIGQTEGYTIVDGHFAMDVVSTTEVFLAFILRRDPDELKQVLKMRGFKPHKTAENIAAEILDICLVDAVKVYGEKKVCEVDVTGRSLEEVAHEILAVIEGHKKCRVGVVDWLSKLESEGRIGEFLEAY
ncbi:MAG: adenylate kinase family protein [Candidatus Bathyarchaeota archaeon]|nr:MAG: adenylate kinase family protein [Candidatus Bathyarchaeota archaeon]